MLLNVLLTEIWKNLNQQNKRIGREWTKAVEKYQPKVKSYVDNGMMGKRDMNIFLTKHVVFKSF